MSRLIRPILASLLIALDAVPANADVTYSVKGVDGALRENVLQHVDYLQLGAPVRLSPRDIDSTVADAIINARAALRPFGYYQPDITARAVRARGDDPVIEITIDRGTPIRIRTVEVSVTGAGREHRRIRQWLRDWPLRQGDVLDQSVWEAQKQLALDTATTIGFLSADFSDRALEIDLETNSADIRLVLDTGEQFVMGDIEFGEHVLKPGIVEHVPRFEQGDPYSETLMNRFRSDLWATGYFTNVDVVEVRRADASPPVVDLEVTLETEARNRYAGALGYGTDAGFRVQTGWSRRPVSSNGDRLDVGIGWQELDDQVTVRGLYRYPRRNRARQFWVSEVTLRGEDLDLEVKREQDDDNFVKLASGDTDEQNIRFGREKIRYLRAGDLRIQDTLFVQYLNSERDFNVTDPQLLQNLATGFPEFDEVFNVNDQAASIGIDLDTINVRGRAFEAIGHRDRGWLFHSNDAFGSSVEFTQAYISTRRSYRWRDDVKFHVRAEVGYTDADVIDVIVDSSAGVLPLSITRLPNFYRFKAGGSYSVRGYAFEELSDNDIGSNNIITASAEMEYRFLPSWSGALFFDYGNAFNDWSDPDLKKGAGVGVRWYSFFGEVRVDVAQALDFEGDPWRLHVTIGTPLL